MNKLPPPKGYTSWLQHAIDMMDCRGAFAEKMFDGDMPTQDDIRKAAQAELDELVALLKLLNKGRKDFHEGKFQSADDFFNEMDADYIPDDGPLTEKQVAALREDAALNMPTGKTIGTENLFYDAYLNSPENFFSGINKELRSELEKLSDAAKGAANNASEAIDDALRVVQESNLRIDAMENGARTGRSVRLNLNITDELYRKLDQMAEKSCISKRDLLRKAIVLMELAVNENAKGNVLAVTDRNHHVLREIVSV